MMNYISSVYDFDSATDHAHPAGKTIDAGGGGSEFFD